MPLVGSHDADGYGNESCNRATETDMTDDIAPPRSGIVTTNDGVQLQVSDWRLPAGAARRGCLLIVHGLGEHIGRYAHVARALVAAGFEVRGYDQRGFGASPGARGAIAYDDALLDDARRVFEAWRDECGDAPVLLGDSMGGAVAARACTGGWIQPRALVLVSPAIAGRLSGLQKVILRIGRRLAPDLPLPSMLAVRDLSRDPAVVAAYRRDPRNHGLATPRLADFVLRAGPQALADAASLLVPTLVMIGTADRLVDVAAARAFHDRLAPSLRSLRVYEGFYHELFNEPAADRARVLADLAAWLVALP
jgi:alpha-beta hydrolase superfamily lysophospholipase